MRATAMRLGMVAIVASLGKGTLAIAEPVAMVSPNAYADIEGDAYVTNGARDGRWQQVLPASDFAPLAAEYQWITQMTLRPDRDLDAPLTTTFDHSLVRLSTTTVSPPNLSLTYANNIGDDETVVYNGPFTVSTDNIGPPTGPKVFDQDLIFDRPFQYDPGAGNLLVDYTYHGLSSPQSMDFLEFPGSDTQYVSGANPDSPTAASTWGGFVLQFTFVTALMGDVNLDGEVNGLDVDPFVEVLLNGTDDNATRTAADMNSDGEVNGLDVDPFVTAVVGGGAQPAPEPSTLLLCILALALVGGRRKWRV